MTGALGDIVRGPAPGPGRAAFVSFNGMVWTNGFPKGKKEGDDAATQTRLALACLDERLAQAGTDKTAR
jgi:enamine deaminase RidA (YjgF/YER057c/UK114 family)